MSLERVSLDRRAFEVLALETRIDILKRLDSRRMTITELSKELGLAKSTVHEHLIKMTDSGLVKKRGNEYKWVYYELTLKGSEILHPHETTKIILLLTSTALALAGGIIGIYRFIEGVPPPEELPPPVGIVHEPKYLIIGLILISLAILSLHLTFRIWRRSNTKTA